MKTPIYRYLLKKLSPSHRWNISNPATRRYLEFFHLKGQRDVNILKEGISKEATRQFKLELIERNRGLGSPIHVDDNLNAMTFFELLSLERKLLKHEVMRCGPHKDVKYLTQLDAIPTKIPRLIDSTLHKYSIDLGLKLGIVGMGSLFGIVFLMLSGSLAFNEMTATVPEALSVYAIPFSLMVAGTAVTEVITYDAFTSKAKSDLYRVSATWDEVFESASFADANLLSLIAKYLTRDGEYYMRWSDLTPIQALELCLKFENKNFRIQSKRILNSPDTKNVSLETPSDSVDSATKQERILVPCALTVDTPVADSHEQRAVSQYE